MMKKFFALIFSLLCVGTIFVGCSKESDQYFYEVYDLWKEKTEAAENVEYYNQSNGIAFESANINTLIATDFSEIKKYQEIFNNIKGDIELLADEFVHDPKLEGDKLKAAQKKVTTYKEQLNSYAEEIADFKNAKHNFEEACENLDFEVAGIIERDEYVSFLSEFRELINSANGVFSKMYDCACSIFYSGKVSGFASNEERQAAVKENYFGTKVVLTTDYIFYCYNNSDETQAKVDRDTIYSNYNNVRNILLTKTKLEKTLSADKISQVDAKIAELHTWIEYYNSETNVIKQAMNDGVFKYSVGGLEANNVENALIKQNHEKYLNLINSIMKNLSETCASLVAFY